MKALVIDASVAAKLLFEEPGSAAAESLLKTRNARLVAPEILPLEVANVIWKRHRRAEVDAAEAAAAFAAISALPLQMLPLLPLLPAAFEIALLAERTVYDALYVAAALQEQGVLVTADQRLANALQQHNLGDRVRLLGA